MSWWMWTNCCNHTYYVDISYEVCKYCIKLESIGCDHYCVFMKMCSWKYVYEMCSSMHVILTFMQKRSHACKSYEMLDIFAEKSNTLLFLSASHLLAGIYLIASGTMMLQDPRERVSGVALPLMRYAYMLLMKLETVIMNYTILVTWEDTTADEEDACAILKTLWTVVHFVHIMDCWCIYGLWCIFISMFAFSYYWQYLLLCRGDYFTLYYCPPHSHPFCFFYAIHLLCKVGISMYQ